MHVIADVFVIPQIESESIADKIAICQKLLVKSCLSFHTHVYGTNMEGPWDEVMSIIKSFHQVFHQEGVTRISSTIKLGTRADKKTSIQGKIDRVNQLLTC